MVLNDNFGIWLAGHFRALTTLVTLVFYVTEGGSSVRFSTYNIGTNQNKYNITTTGAFSQLGKGTTPANRQDFKIESPFLVPVESTKVKTFDGGYNSGLGFVQVPTLFSPTGDSGALTEVVLFMTFHKFDVATIDQKVLFTRDSVPVVNFISGKTINTEHGISI